MDYSTGISENVLNSGKLGTAASDIIYVKPLIRVLGYLLQYLLKFALHLFSLRLKCYYNQKNSMGTERKNIVPGNLSIIWKLNEAWPLKKYSAIFLRLLKLLKLKKSSTTGLRLLKVFNTEKGTPSLSYDSLFHQLSGDRRWETNTRDNGKETFYHHEKLLTYN